MEEEGMKVFGLRSAERACTINLQVDDRPFPSAPVKCLFIAAASLIACQAAAELI
jgi:hypothetical protein